MTRRFVQFSVTGALVAWFCVASIGSAQDEPAADPSASDASADDHSGIGAQRKALAEQISLLREAIAVLGEGEAAAERLRGDFRILERIDGLYLRWQEQIHRGAELQRQRDDVEQRIAAGFEAVVGDSPPYSLSRIDEFHDARRGASAREADLEELERVAREGREQSRVALEEKQKHRREILGAEADLDRPFEVEARARALERTLLEIRLVRTQNELARAELDNATAELALQQLETSIGDETLDWARERLEFDPLDLDRAVSTFENRELEAREVLDRARVELASAESRLASAQASLDGSDRSDAAKLEAHRLARQVAHRHVVQIDAELARIPTLRSFAERRHLLLSGKVARSDMRDWEEQADALAAKLERHARLAEGRATELGRRLTETVERADESSDAGEARWLRRQAAEIDRLIGLYRAEFEDLSSSAALARRAAGDLAHRTQRFSLVDLFDSAISGVARVWDTELLVVDDRSVTIAKVISAVILFVLGYIVSRFASRLLRRVLSRTFSMDSGAALAFQGLSFYLLLTLFLLLSLRTVGIPLTAFTVLGGGIAIGIGFGSQNIVNNFFSGLILMVERPIKVGDIVEVDETYGHIEQIGARSTRVRTFDNIHIIVPNSAFLEQNVVNWTLSDNLVRTYVEVGVAYGSPTREVDRLIHRALADHGKVLDDPEPVVLFTEFGDNALGFRAYFWLRMRLMMDRRRVESDVRHRIDRLFRDAGIAIAFPQRDVHLDTLSPLEVRLSSPDDESESV